MSSILPIITNNNQNRQLMWQRTLLLKFLHIYRVTFQHDKLCFPFQRSFKYFLLFLCSPFSTWETFRLQVLILFPLFRDLLSLSIQIDFDYRYQHQKKHWNKQKCVCEWERERHSHTGNSSNPTVSFPFNATAYLSILSLKTLWWHWKILSPICQNGDTA